MRAGALSHGRAAALALLVGVAVAAPATAAGSELLARDVTGVTLTVDGRGRALVSYRSGGAVKHVLAWGAINARSPSRSRRQVRFRLRYGGRHGLRGSCGAYDGPALAWLVAACKAPDGSYWALQSWHRLVPNLGGGVITGARELRLSHWRGELPELDVTVGWRGRHHLLAGRLTYRGRPVHGFGSTRRGSPLDGYGRNVYVDTLDSAYGRGWRRENGFLTRRPTGTFCYGLIPRAGRPSGMGQAYRATVIGPGVTPDAFWSAAAPTDTRSTAARSRCR